MPTVADVSSRIDSMERRVDRNEKFIFGNGSEGMVSRLVRMEEGMKESQKDICSISDDVTDVKKIAYEIKSLIKVHVDSSDVHTMKGLLYQLGLGKVVGFVGFFFTAFTVWIIILIKIIPSDLGLWELISKWLGF